MRYVVQKNTETDWYILDRVLDEAFCSFSTWGQAFRHSILLNKEAA